MPLSQIRLNDLARLRTTTHIHAPPACKDGKHDPSCPRTQEAFCKVIRIDTSGGKGPPQFVELALCAHIGVESYSGN